MKRCQNLPLLMAFTLLIACNNDDDLSDPCTESSPALLLQINGFEIAATVGGGTAPYTYEWSNGSAEAVLNNEPSGNYSLTVTDANGCIATAEVDYVHPCQNSDLSLHIIALLSSAEVTVQGGEPPYNFLWSNGASTANIAQVPPGVYSLTASDAIGCQVTSSIEIKDGCQGLAQIADAEGNVYPVVEIGGQCWMAENLRVTAFADGSPLELIANTQTWAFTNGPHYAWYSPDGSSFAPYGYAYNWAAVQDPRNLCPTGWRPATDAQWTILTDYVGGSLEAGGMLKAVEGWDEPNAGATNGTGFTALPGGEIRNSLGFIDVGKAAYFWTSTEEGDGFAYQRNINNSFSNVSRFAMGKKSGLSVRCLKE